MDNKWFFTSLDDIKKLRLRLTEKKGVWIKLKGPELNSTGEIPVCGECGRKIVPDATFCEGCHAPVVRRYCPRCSKLVPETTSLCPYCGASAKAAPRYVPDLTTWATVGIMIALAVGVFFMTKSPEVKPTRPAVVQQKEAKAAPARPAQLSAVNTAVAAETPPTAEQAVQLNLQAHELIAAGRYNEAIPILQKALKAFSSESKDTAYKYILYNLAHSLRKVGRIAEAIPLLEQCLKADQSWEKARQELEIARVRAAVE